jgi:hypothetical protein
MPLTHGSPINGCCPVLDDTSARDYRCRGESDMSRQLRSWNEIRGAAKWWIAIGLLNLALWTGLLFVVDEAAHAWVLFLFAATNMAIVLRLLLLKWARPQT